MPIHLENWLPFGGHQDGNFLETMKVSESKRECVVATKAITLNSASVNILIGLILRTSMLLVISVARIQ